jgi:hypothetical protein
VQRSHVTATGDRLVGRHCFLQSRLGPELYDSVQRRVDFCDAREQHLGELARGNLFAVQYSSRISRRLQQWLVHVSAAHQLISGAVSICVELASQRLDYPHDVVHGATVNYRGRLLDLGQIHD